MDESEETLSGEEFPSIIELSDKESNSNTVVPMDGFVKRTTTSYNPQSSHINLSYLDPYDNAGSLAYNLNNQDVFKHRETLRHEEAFTKRSENGDEMQCASPSSVHTMPFSPFGGSDDLSVEDQLHPKNHSDLTATSYDSDSLIGLAGMHFLLGNEVQKQLCTELLMYEKLYFNRSQHLLNNSIGFYSPTTKDKQSMVSNKINSNVEAKQIDIQEYCQQEKKHTLADYFKKDKLQFRSSALLTVDEVHRNTAIELTSKSGCRSRYSGKHCHKKGERLSYPNPQVCKEEDKRFSGKRFESPQVSKEKDKRFSGKRFERDKPSCFQSSTSTTIEKSLQQFRCEHCEKSFNTLAKLRIHMKILHKNNSQKAIMCPTETDFPTHNSLLSESASMLERSHFRGSQCNNVHSTCPNYARKIDFHECPYCTAAFTSFVHLMSHMEKHSDFCT